MVSKSSCVRPTTHELTTQVNEANEVLSDAARRAVYDAERARAAAPAPDSQKRKASKKRKAPRDDDFIADSDEEESEEESDDDDEEEPARPPPRAPPKRRAPPKTGLEALTVAQLKAKCEAKGLKVSGTKGVLIARLEDAARGIYDRPQPRRAPAAPRRRASTGSRQRASAGGSRGGSFFNFSFGGGGGSLGGGGGGEGESEGVNEGWWW